MDQENREVRAVSDGLPAEKAALLAFAARDLDEFLARHADVDIAQLMENEGFLRFCGSRMGRESLAELYDDYVSLIESAGAAAAERARSRAGRSTGGGLSGGETLSPAQKYVLDAWNEEHPEMAMTAREFLGR